MPQFLFHVFDDDQTTDCEGKHLLDLNSARVFAIKAARGIMAEELQTRGFIDLNHWIEIEDELGDVTVLTFGDAAMVRTEYP